MKCQFCESQATVHLTDIANKQKREMHLCEGCARKHNLIPDQPTPQVDLKALMGLWGAAAAAAGHPAPAAEATALTCPACGLQYGEFRTDGRLGCADEYDAFRVALEPLLERIHRAVRHTGKAPRVVRRRRWEAQLRDLREAMAAAAAAEKYEEAARLRDLIRQKEASDEPR